MLWTQTGEKKKKRMRVTTPSPVLLSSVSAVSLDLILLSYLGEPEDDDEEDEPPMAAAMRGNLVSECRQGMLVFKSAQALPDWQAT